MRKRRIIIAAVVLALLVGATVVVWHVADWPPPRLILTYGFPPTGGPTGRTKVIEGIEFVELKPGYFRMGSHYKCGEASLLERLGALIGLPGCGDGLHSGPECPPHWVEVRGPIWIATTEVTNEAYQRLMPDHDSMLSPGLRHPVTVVTHLDATAYCRLLSERHKMRFRLPTESEWEYACRAGSCEPFCFGNDATSLGQYAICEIGEEREHTAQVATLRPNAWGLYDMHGNVWEWCRDRWFKSYHEALAAGPALFEDRARHRVIRGGGWADQPRNCRCTVRDSYLSEELGPDSWDLGFRPVFTLSGDE